MSTIHTIGHSTRTLDELVAALAAHNVRTLVDIRAFPASRRLPHFNRESLEQELPKRGIRYVWMKELGGHRKKIRNDSPNTGLRNDSFRNYADYMLTTDFAQAIERLLEITSQTADPSTTAAKAAPPVGMTNQTQHQLDPAQYRIDAAGPDSSPAPSGIAGAGNTAYMCAERMYFQCHRMLVSDYLTAHGHTVLHIEDDKRPLREHKLMAEAHLVSGQLLYNAQQLF